MKLQIMLLLIAHAAMAGDHEFFESKIRPVLAEKCYECHSAEAGKSKGGLLLDTREGIRQGGDTGPAVVPGDPEKSLLIHAIRWHDPDTAMPSSTSSVSITKPLPTATPAAISD